MLIRFFRLAIAALALLIGGLVTADTNIPIANPDFATSTNSSAIPGWTYTPYDWQPTPDYKGPPNVSSQGLNHLYGYDYLLPSEITSKAVMTCLVCPAGPNNFNTLSQQVNGLVFGKKYQLKFHAWGYWYSSYGVPISIRGTQQQTGPVQASLGSQNSELLTVPHEMISGVAPWKEFTINFTYKDIATSALLKLTQFASGFGMPCVHCNAVDYLLLTGVRLTQISGAAPILTVNKELAGNRVADTDQFIVQILQNGTVANSITNSTTSGAGSNVNANSGTTGATILTSGTSYTINEVASGTTKLAQHTSTLSCTDSTGANRALALNTAFTLQDDEVVSCKITNTPKAPTLRLSKALGVGGRIDNTDQFTVQIQSRFTDVTTATTTGTGSNIIGGRTDWATLVAGSNYNLAEMMVAGSASKIGQYDSVVSCTNAWAGSPTVIPTATATPFTLVPGDALDCTITNTAKPVKMTLTQLVISPFPVNLLPPFKFNYSINNGWPVNPQALTTTTLNVPVSTAQQTLAARNVVTTLSTNLPDARWFVSSFACTDGNAPGDGNSTGNLVRVVGTSVTIPADKVRAGSALKCTLTMGHKVP